MSAALGMALAATHESWLSSVMMIAYQAYNIKGPFDGEAAMWVDLNRSGLPTDTRDIHPPETA